jgi:hypothetical protein
MVPVPIPPRGKATFRKFCPEYDLKTGQLQVTVIAISFPVIACKSMKSISNFRRVISHTSIGINSKGADAYSKLWQFEF